MAGVKSITDRILSDARAKEKEIVGQAEREAKRIIDDATGDAEKSRARILAAAEKEAERARERAVSSAGLEGKKRVLAAKQEILEDTFRRAEASIGALPGEEYEALLVELIVANASGGEEVLLGEADAKRVDAARLVDAANRGCASRGVAENLTLSRETAPVDGVLLRRGDVEIDLSVGTLLRTQREQLEQELAAILFH